MKKKTLYEILEVAETATDETIHASFERLKRIHGQDLDRRAGDAFRFICDAYEVLGNPIKRREYDRKLATSRMPNTSVYGESVGDERSGTKYLVGLLVFVSLGYAGWRYSQIEESERAANLAHRKELAQQDQARQSENEERQREEQRKREERAWRQENERALREQDWRMRQNEEALRRRESAEESRRRQEEQQARYEEERRRRDAEAVARREKQYLQQLCYDRYGRPC